MNWQDYPHLHGLIKNIFIEEEYRWCQNANAKNEKGEAVDFRDWTANEFCLIGAIYKVYFNTSNWNIISRYLSQIMGNSFWEGSLLQWNDDFNRTKEQVINFLDKYNL